MKPFLPLVGLLCVCTAALSAAEPYVWQLDRTNLIGDQKPEVLGAPRVVQEYASKALYFNGTSDGLFVPVNPLKGLDQFTIEALINPAADGPEAQRFLHVQDNLGEKGDAGSRALLEIRLTNGSWSLDTFLFSKTNDAKLALLDTTKRHVAGMWTWVALVYANGHMTSYVNGQKELEGDVAFLPMGPGRVSLGVRQNKVYWFKGGLGAVRWFSVALPAEQLRRIGLDAPGEPPRLVPPAMGHLPP